MENISYTASDIRKIVDVQRAFFRTGVTLVISPFNFPILLTLGVVAANTRFNLSMREHPYDDSRVLPILRRLEK